MALFREHREYPRLHCNTPLELTCVTDIGYESFQATVCNISQTGIYLETDYTLKQDDDILVRALQKMPEGVPATLFKGNLGIIMWFKALEGKRHRFFGAGVRIFFALRNDLRKGEALCL